MRYIIVYTTIEIISYHFRTACDYVSMPNNDALIRLIHHLLNMVLYYNITIL